MLIRSHLSDNDLLPWQVVHQLLQGGAHELEAVHKPQRHQPELMLPNRRLLLRDEFIRLEKAPTYIILWVHSSIQCFRIHS